MNNIDITQWRLARQHISNPDFDQPDQIVAWMGAMQAQDFAAAKWAVGLRTKGITESDIDRAFAAGAILRTHVLRPTWHFVTPADIRWMLALTAPRIIAASAYQYRNLALDDYVFKRSNVALAKALQGGQHATRSELVTILSQAGIKTDDLRLIYLLMRAELDGVICSGGRRGKQFTYALLDERAPRTRNLERDEALAELAQRYFISRGPATLQDFVWWSGLSKTDARNGLDMIKSQLTSIMIDTQEYWFIDSASLPKRRASTAYLLPNYDEYMVGYHDRRAIFDAAHAEKIDQREGLLANAIIINGQIQGTWKRILTRKDVSITLKPFVTPTEIENQSLAKTAAAYGKYLDLPVALM